MAGILIILFAIGLYWRKTEQLETRDEIDALLLELEEVKASAARARAHQAALNSQLLEDYGIVYNAPCDWYRKVTRGVRDDA